MKIYLSNPYGTIPGEAWREYRFYLLGQALFEEGHEVVWFTSSFSHHFKKHRTLESKQIVINSKFCIHLIKSPGYKNNISLGRLYRDFIYGFNLRKILISNYDKPDAFIIADSPLIFYFPSYQYCRKNKVPYVIDQMDLWPELVVDSLPKRLRSIGNLCFSYHYFFRNQIYNNASGFISLAKKYYQIPLSYSPNLAKIPNAIIYNGIPIDEYSKLRDSISQTFSKQLPKKDVGDIWFIFAGTLGPSYDIRTILTAFHELNVLNIKLFIAGDGSERKYVEDFLRINQNSNIYYLGKLNKSELANIYFLSDVGLNAYGPYSNVEMSDKFYDYTAVGLAIINSLKGEVSDLLLNYNLGLNYKAESISSLKQAFLTYVANPDLLSSHKVNSKKISIKFDKKSQMEKFKNFWKDFSISTKL
jgi:glycosyltransferase involved in cell wall biosynthesis